MSPGTFVYARTKDIKSIGDRNVCEGADKEAHPCVTGVRVHADVLVRACMGAHLCVVRSYEAFVNLYRMKQADPKASKMAPLVTLT
jgi:hypothetical protein